MSTPRPRRLIWVRGQAEAGERWAREFLANRQPSRVAWIGIDHPPGQGRAYLGQTLEAAVIDTHAGLDPDDWGALSGAVQGGGALIILSPPANEWAERLEPAPQPWLSHGLTAADLRHGFVRRLIRHLSEDALVECLDLPTSPRRQPVIEPLNPDSITGLSEATANAQQQRVIEALEHLAHQPTPQVVLITAERGRGKSAALGMAMRALQGHTLRLTGPSRAAVATACQYAGDAAPAFLAPEHVRPEPTPLIVDEAAALPLGTLERWLSDNPRCALSATVHGYEGSGRGLLLRLVKSLEQRGVNLLPLQLEQPLRFPPSDPLEEWIARWLLLRPTPPSPNPAKAKAALRIERESPERLSDDESPLKKVYGLLFSAHYQTRPRDLRQLLDDPEIVIECAWRDQQLVGVLLARREGGFSRALCHAVYHGTRRPSGHLIAQSLTFHAGIADAAASRGLRIQRLAVRAEDQRQGVGQALVERARTLAMNEGLDWLGTSFGGRTDLVDFWQQTGLDCVRIGNRLEPRSGAHALIFLQGLSATGHALYHSARERFAIHYPDQRRHTLAELPDDLAARLKCPTLEHSMPRIDAADLQAFAYGHRALWDSHGALMRWFEQRGSTITLSAQQRALLRAAIDDPLNSAAITQAAGASGQREALAELRRATRQGLNQTHE
ncbi:MAG: GNAT family N-acetyltransferase [Spiribacter sp.]|nr:GNAT family N-acetyltransferase [Spiribacter sp.]